jgi:hypothetical protein
MPSNYILLETVTVGAAGASSIAFKNIPQSGYTDLCLKLSARASATGTGGINCYWAFNGSASNFSSRWLIGSGTAASSANRADAFTVEVSGATQTANTFSSADFYITNYTSSNFKSYSIDNVVENNGSAANSQIVSGLWSNTAAINSIEIVCGSGNFIQNTTFYLYGISTVDVTPTIGPKAIGGNIIETDGTYWYHAFLNSGTFTPTTNLTCDYLVVGGGGGGGAPSGDAGGGGGGGGYRTSLGGSALSLTGNTVYAAIVGSGGSSSGYGADSIFANIVSTGGGRGGGDRVVGGCGGSGGGGGSGNSTVAGGTGTSGQGNNGGSGSNSNSNYLAGGGGGAGAIGGSVGYPTSTAGSGGVGLNTNSAWATATGTGVNGYYAGGGGGCAKPSGTAGSGGTGGGGAGATGSGNGTAGTPNTGGGGGGGVSLGGVGGSGIVIVRYAI